MTALLVAEMQTEHSISKSILHLSSLVRQWGMSFLNTMQGNVSVVFFYYVTRNQLEIPNVATTTSAMDQNEKCRASPDRTLLAAATGLLVGPDTTGATVGGLSVAVGAKEDGMYVGSTTGVAEGESDGKGMNPLEVGTSVPPLGRLVVGSCNGLGASVGPYNMEQHPSHVPVELGQQIPSRPSFWQFSWRLHDAATIGEGTAVGNGLVGLIETTVPILGAAVFDSPF